MRTIIIFTLIYFTIIGCKSENAMNTAKISDGIKGTGIEVITSIPDITINESRLQYDNSTSLWSLNDTLFSGYKVSYYDNGVLKSRTAIYNGRRQNLAAKWYEDGRLKEEANYYSGKLHGEKKIWSIESDHILISHLDYTLGKVHGEQKQWYKTGEVYKILNFNMGIEEGIQQAYRKNGDLYANYEAKEGRIFGLKKSALCYGLEDQNIKYDK